MNFVEDILHGPTGSAKWDSDFTRFKFICPCGCNSFNDLPIKPPHDNGWTWDGNKENPTLSPSIINYNCGWHGYLKAGVWEKC